MLRRELGLREGGAGAREALWDSRIGRSGVLTGEVLRGLGGGSSGGTRMVWKGVP